MPRLLKYILLAVIGALLAIAITLFTQNNRMPQLGHNNGQLEPLPTTPNAISSQTNDRDRHVEPLPFKATLMQTHKALITAMNRYGGAEIITNQPDYLHIVFTTPVMRFHDDLEFYLNSTVQQVEVRSASRTGHSDLGLNRDRYNALRQFYLEND